MRSNNLLLSLLANSSANPRSNSLMHKDAYSNPYTNGVRSNSMSNVQAESKQVKVFNAQNNVCLVRLVHFLNLKLKNHYYFFFCKLENSLKNHKTIKKEDIQKVQNYEIYSQDIVKQQIPSNIAVKAQQKWSSEISVFCDSFNTFKSKREILLQKQLIQSGFTNILTISSKKRSAALFVSLLKRQILKQQRQALNIFAKIEKERMRNQIFILNLNQIISKTKTQSFGLIKLFVKSKQQKSKQIMINIPNEIKISQFTQNQSENFKKQQALSSNYQNSQKTNRSKKIILRERKISTTQPIASISLISGKIKVGMTQDIPLNNTTNNRKIQEKMGRCHNLKPDIAVNCLPDLNDNCHLFRQCEFPSFPAKIVYTVQNYYTQFKEPSDLECLTDRSIKNTQSQFSKSAKNTPKYCKDKSTINLALKKQVNLKNHEDSPLAKIDEILNKIEQMKSYRSAEKSSEKRMVNNQKKSQIEQPNPIKYRTKTLNQKYEESQKQNIRERLITERQKPVKTFRGLESGSKYRSTVLSKSKQPKSEFTAKKMKMEIENIISRRNKQLYYRGDPTQLN